MFGSKEKSTSSLSSKESGGSESGQTCVITKGTVIEGKFNCSENVRLDGTIMGEVKVEKRLVLGDTGKIEGNVWANHTVVQGFIQGIIHIADTLHLQSTAKIKGTIAAAKMIVDEGAKYEGECKIGEQGNLK